MARSEEGLVNIESIQTLLTFATARGAFDVLRTTVRMR